MPVSAQNAAAAASAAERAPAGALAGLLCWLSYSAVEVLFTTTRVLAGRTSSALFTDDSWLTTFALLGLYCGLGLLCGAAVGLLVQRERKGVASLRLRSSVNLTIALGVLLSVALSGERTPAALSAAALSGLAALALLAREPRPGPLRRFAANPFALSLALVGLPALAASLADGATPIATATVVAVLIALSVAADRFALGSASDPDWRMRPFACWVAAAVLFALASVWALNPAVSSPRGVISNAADRKPNVVLVVWDTVRADHLSPYGYGRDTTPFLSELAEQSTLFRNPISVSDMTLPAHGSLFTGMYPAWHGAYISPADSRARPIMEQIPTLAEMLAEAGFATAAVAANVGYVSREMGMARGFDTFVSLTEARIFDAALPHLVRNLLRPAVSIGRANYHFDASTLAAGAVDDIALPLLDDIARDGGSFFLFLNYMDAHGPYRPPPPFLDRYPGRMSNHSNADFYALLLDALAGRRAPTEKEQRHLTALYDGALAYLDAELERLVAELERLGVYENTLLVVTSDHGELLGEKGLLDHAVGMHHRLLHVPLVIKFPGRQAPAVVERSVSLVDVFPTILEVAGLPVSDDIQGFSLLGDSRHVDVHAMHSPSQTVARANPAFRREAFSLVRDSWKVVHTASEQPRIYDLSVDPDELHDLYDPSHERLQALANDSESWILSRPSLDGAAPELSPRQKRRLRSLGYIQ